MNRYFLVILNSITLLVVIFINSLAGSGLLGELSVGEISNKYDTLFAPAGYAFSIWGLIYLMLIGFVGFQWVTLIKKSNNDVIEKTGLIFFLSGLANIGWLLLWVNERIGLSVFPMILLLLTLILLVYRLRLEIWDAPVRIIFFVWWPFAIYLGWITVATVANVAAFLTIVWTEYILTPQQWTIIMIVVATGIYIAMIVRRNLRESAAVGIWAFIAIAVRQGSINIGITIAAGLAALLLLSIIVYHGYKNLETSPVNKLRRGEF